MVLAGAQMARLGETAAICWLVVVSEVNAALTPMPTRLKPRTLNADAVATLRSVSTFIIRIHRSHRLGNIGVGAATENLPDSQGMSDRSSTSAKASQFRLSRRTEDCGCIEQLRSNLGGLSESTAQRD